MVSLNFATMQRQQKLFAVSTIKKIKKQKRKSNTSAPSYALSIFNNKKWWVFNNEEAKTKANPQESLWTTGDFKDKKEDNRAII